jgi:hypothetical protein
VTIQVCRGQVARDEKFRNTGEMVGKKIKRKINKI